MPFPKLRLVYIATAALIALTSANAEAEGVDFSGETVTIVVGYGPGGGYDTLSRLVADHIGQYLPGNPTVIVENMPGGAGNRSLIFMAKAAGKDGTALEVLPALFDVMAGKLGADVKAEEFQIVGRLMPNVSIGVTWNTSPTKTIADAQKRGTTFATTGGAGDTNHIIAHWMNDHYGTKFDIVGGYSGTGEMILAMERGEVEGFSYSIGTLKQQHPEWLADKMVNVLWQNSTERRPDLPDTPALPELARDDEERALLSLFASQGDVGRSLALPPGVPDDVVVVYRDAFDAMVKDPAFLADAKKRGVDLEVAEGADMQKGLEGIATAPQAVRDALIALINANNQ